MEKFFWFKRNKKQVAFDEIDEMIATVDRNGDGRISYSEFRSKDLIFSEKKTFNFLTVKFFLTEN